MKLMSLKMRKMLVLLVLVVGTGCLNALPAQAHWKVTLTYTGTSVQSTPTYGLSVGTPTPPSSYAYNQGVDCLSMSGSGWITPPGLSGSFVGEVLKNDLYTVATFEWESADGPVPSTVTIYESLEPSASVSPNRNHPSSYGSSIQFLTDIDGLPTTVVPTVSSGDFGQFSHAEFSHTVTVPSNGTFQLPARQLKSSLLLDLTSIPSNELPVSYQTAWIYYAGTAPVV